MRNGHIHLVFANAVTTLYRFSKLIVVYASFFLLGRIQRYRYIYGDGIHAQGTSTSIYLAHLNTQEILPTVQQSAIRIATGNRFLPGILSVPYTCWHPTRSCRVLNNLRTMASLLGRIARLDIE